MAQEVNTLETRNGAGGLTGAIGAFFGGIGKVVTAAAPLATDVYRLRLQSDTLRNQSAAELATLQAEQARLIASASQPGTPVLGGIWQPWMTGATALIGALLLLGLILRRRR